MKKATDIIIQKISYLFSRFKLTSNMFIVFGIYSSYFQLAALCLRGKCCLNCIRNIKYKMQVLHTFVFRYIDTCFIFVNCRDVKATTQGA